MYINLPEEVNYIFSVLEEHAFEAFVVGGCVRDTLLGFVVEDWDITTNARPEDIISLFTKTIPTGIKHGTITIILNDKQFEITTYRVDGEYSNSRHPDTVSYSSSIEEDLSRRDFTMNSIAYNYQSGLLDPFNGVEDIKGKIIRTVGLPQVRFSEDALRMLRAIRFCCKLDFQIDSLTLDAIKRNAKRINCISSERIREEINKILISNNPSMGIMLLKNTDLLKYIFPELIFTIGFDQKNPHHDKDIFNHILSVLENTPTSLIVRLAALFHDIGKPNCFSIDKKGIGHFYSHNIESAKISKAILSRLKYDNDTIAKVCTLIQEHMCLFQGFKDITLKRLIVRVGKDNLDELYSLLIADKIGHKGDPDLTKIDILKEKIDCIILAGEPLSIKELKIGGEDLLALGYVEGPIIGEILEYLLQIVLQNPTRNEKSELVAEALKKYSLN